MKASKKLFFLIQRVIQESLISFKPIFLESTDLGISRCNFVMLGLILFFLLVCCLLKYLSQFYRDWFNLFWKIEGTEKVSSLQLVSFVQMSKRIIFPINILSKIFSLKTKVKQNVFPLTGIRIRNVFSCSHTCYFKSCDLFHLKSTTVGRFTKYSQRLLIQIDSPSNAITLGWLVYQLF